MMLTARRLLAYVLAFSLACMGVIQPAQAALIGTEQVALAQGGEASRARIAAALARPAVQAKLQALGIDAASAEARVAALTDDQAAALADKIDSLPAGGDGIIGALVFIFLVLLVTDILGLTKVFPFTRSAKR